MLDLIERLEKAEVGSQDLDALFAQIAAKPSTLLNSMTFDEAIERFPNDLHGISRNWPVPAYTTSLDAIVALIGEKSPLRGPVSIEMAGSGFCAIADTIPCADGVAAWGNTPPLACCIALLRALSTKEQTRDG